MRSITTIIICMLPLIIFAQPHVLWERTYGDEITNPVFVVDPAGGYFLGGETRVEGLMNYHLSRIEQDGDVAWTQNYDLFVMDHEELQPTDIVLSEICPTPDGGILMAGLAQDYHQGHSWHLINVNGQGEEIWRRDFLQRRENSSLLPPRALISTAEGNFLLAGVNDFEDDEGNPQEPVQVILFTQEGDIIWSVQFEREFDARVREVIEVEDGYVLCGTIMSDRRERITISDAWICRLNGDGEVVWDMHFARESGSAGPILELADGGYMVVGSGNIDGPINSPYNIFLGGCNNNGEEPWERYIELQFYSLAGAVLPTPGGNFVMAGATRAQNLNDPSRLFVMTCDREGNHNAPLIFDQFELRFGIGLLYDPEARSVSISAGTEPATPYLARLDFPPEIFERVPQEDSLIFLSTEENSMSISAADFETEELQYSWIVGDEVVGDQSELIFPNLEPGDYRVAAYASDGNLVDSTEWVITLTRMVLSHSPESDTLSIESGDSLLFSLQLGVPQEESTLLWLLNGGVVGSESAQTISFPLAGNFTVRAEIDWREREDFHEWTVHVENPDAVFPEPFPVIPYQLTLANFPNPFNSSTNISYFLPQSGRYAIDLVDIRGRLVARLSDGWKEAGSYREVWDGRGVTSGYYTISIKTNGLRLERGLIIEK